MPPIRAPVTVLLGTRPEAIKLAPVVRMLQRAGMRHEVVTTGQHVEMVREALDLFDIPIGSDLGLFRPGQGLDHLLARTVESVGRLLDEHQPAALVVQGDTTSMLGSAVAAVHHGVPVAHVEAGLRSHDLGHPFPEEMNRQLVSRVARWHFAPTDRAAANLAREGIGAGIHVVGNTVVDAVRHILRRVGPLPAPFADFVRGHRYVLATAHRRESWAGGISSIAAALREVLDARPDVRLVFATHPNPIARAPVDAELGDHPGARVVDALPYPTFLGLLAGAWVAVSDSGGVQEEGPTLGVPVLVTRTTTERPEGVEAGAASLVGTDREGVRDATLRMLDDVDHRAAMAERGRSIYGDGHAAERIVDVLAREVG